MITPRQTICFILSVLAASSCALSQSGPQRVARVKVLADSRFQEQDPRWRDTAAALIQAASDYLEREFGIRLVTASLEPWRLEERIASMAGLLRRLKEDYPLDGESDLVVAFTRENINVYSSGRARVDRIGDCREGLGRYVVSWVSGPHRYRGPDSEPELDALALIHEIGHIFGAEHSREIDSVMHEDFAYRTEFDKKNREIILRNKFCPFAKD